MSDKFSIRWVQNYDVRADAMPSKLDVLYGVANLRPSFAVRVIEEPLRWFQKLSWRELFAFGAAAVIASPQKITRRQMFMRWMRRDES